MKLCPMCELRERQLQASGRLNAYCPPCWRVVVAMSRYWIAKGMPLAWDSRKHTRLAVVRTDCTVCRIEGRQAERSDMCLPCYRRVRRMARRIIQQERTGKVAA